MPSPVNRKEWEDALVLGASYFTHSRPKLGPRPRGQRLEWEVIHHHTLRDASECAAGNPRALIYAVSPSGDSAPLARADWPRYLKMRGES